MMDLGTWDDDPRGLRKKKSFHQKVLAQNTKISWAIVLILLVGIWYLHSHKKSLNKELHEHKKQKKELEGHVGHLNERIKSTNRQLSQVTRTQHEISHSVSEHQARASRLEGDHRECQETLDEARATIHDLKEQQVTLKHHYEVVSKRADELDRQLVTERQGHATALQIKETELQALRAQATLSRENEREEIPKPVDSVAENNMPQRQIPVPVPVQGAQAGGTHGTQENGGAQGVSVHVHETSPTPVPHPIDQNHGDAHHDPVASGILEGGAAHDPRLHRVGFGGRRWHDDGAAAGGRAAVDQHDQHGRAAPLSKRIKKGGRKRGSLSMLEEALGHEHNAEEYGYEDNVMHGVHK